MNTVIKPTRLFIHHTERIELHKINAVLRDEKNAQ